MCLSKDHLFPFPQCFLPSVYLCNVTTTRTIGQQTPPAFKHAAGITYVSVPDTLHDFRQYAGQCFDKRRPPLFFHLRCILDSPWCDVTALYVRVVALKLHLLTCIILVRIMHNLCIRLPVLKNVSWKCFRCIIYRHNNFTDKKCIAWVHCKSLWRKASAKCINVNVINERVTGAIMEDLDCHLVVTA